VIGAWAAAVLVVGYGCYQWGWIRGYGDATSKAVLEILAMRKR
jgi:hypothetical protein